MKIGNYIKSKAIAGVVFFVTVGATALLLWVAGVGAYSIVAICTLLFVAFAAALAWDYAKRRRFYQEIRLVTQEFENVNYITEHLGRPGFLEGQLTYDALVQATKDMNDRIAEYRVAAGEYRDYVETWIHEVKTPIAAARLILDNSADHRLQLLAGEMDRIEAHVEQALYYARSTAVEKDYLIKQVDLDRAVKATVKKLSRLLIENGIVPTFEGLDTKVYADPKWLDFVLGQIIVNSVKYCRPRSDGFTPQIVFATERIGDLFETAKVKLHIKDNGIGIPATDIDRVFEKGFTGENGRAFAKSTGIGLYLCKKLCQKMKLGLSIASVAAAAPESADDSVIGAAAEDTSEGAGGTTVTIEFSLNKMYFLE